MSGRIFFTESASRTIWTAEEFNSSFATYLSQSTSATRRQPRSFTAAEITRVRARRNELFCQWDSVDTGSILELCFE